MNDDGRHWLLAAIHHTFLLRSWHVSHAGRSAR